MPSEIQDRLRVIQKLRDISFKRVSDNILQAQDKQKRDYERRHRGKKKFDVGSSVLLWNLRRDDRKGGKMADPWLGPYTAFRVFNNGTYDLKSQDGQLMKKNSMESI